MGYIKRNLSRYVGVNFIIGLAHLRLPELQTIWLDGCNVTVDAALQLSSEHCKNLTYISMRYLQSVVEDEFHVVEDDYWFEYYNILE